MTLLSDDPAQREASTPRLADEEDRRRIREDLHETLIVEAAAGTGKTTELVCRIVRLLASGRARVEQIVAVTFTEKAAGELKLRLREGLEEARRAARRQEGLFSMLENLERALASLEEAHVSTIHGFCAELLRERPVEAEVDPAFRTLTDGEARRLFDDAFNAWLQAHLEDPPEGVRRSLRRPSSFNSEGATGRLAAAGWVLAEWRDFPEPWRRDPWDRMQEIDSLVDRLNAFADLTRQPLKTDDNLYTDTAPIRRVSESIRQNEAVRPRDYDGLEASFVALASDWILNRRARKGSGQKYNEQIVRSQVLARRETVLLGLQEFARSADADLAALLHGELAGCLERYQQLKNQGGRLDFVDLLVRARNLVRECVPVRTEFQRRFTHIFVDEFQDTDPLQAELLLLLASDDPAVVDWRRVSPVPGKLFVVGDPKQSIYRFRRAEVGIYQEVKEQLLARGARLVHLRTSFRASPDIQHVVNAAFAPVMTGDRFTLQADYVALEPFRREIEGRPSVVVLPVPEPYGSWGKITRQAVEQSLPDATAAFLHWLITKSGWKITERDRPDPVDIAARHVCLLFRRFEKFGQDVTRGYLEALEARGVPHLLVGGKSFHHREEVETIRAALSAIEWPDDELAVFATLRGGLFAVGDEALLEYRHRFGRLHPFRIAGGDSEPLSDNLAPVTWALRCLQELHRHRNDRPITDTIERLLEVTRAHAGFVLRPSGEQALANVLQTVELARTYERDGGLSFRGFVDQLRDEADRGQAPEAPILEEGSDGVRLMTVHKAKGLEFPVVVLVDISAPLSHDQAARYVDRSRGLCAVRLKGWSPIELLEHEAEEVARERAEGIRVAYVAATRARDLLVIPAVGDQPFDGWISTLNPAVYPAPGTRPADASSLGCPAFGRDSVSNRPEDAAGTIPVSPGLHVFPATETAAKGESYSVVWWDPKTLDLGVLPEFGKRYEQLVDKNAGAAVVEKGRRLYEKWRGDRLQAIQWGRTAGVTVTTATRKALDEAATAKREGARQPLLDVAFHNVEVVELAPHAGRPSGARYGALVHAVLATVPLDADRALIEEIAGLQARILGAPDSESQSAAVTVETALGHPLLDRARRAGAGGECRRETPVTLLQTDGSLIEGVVDLAFRENGHWTVVDFKTDRELAQGLEIYRRQVELYARAVEESTGERATPILMKI